MNPTTPTDPAIDEIRDIRHRISAEHGHDPAKLVEYLMQYQEQFKNRLTYDPQSGATTTDVKASERPSAT